MYIKFKFIAILFLVYCFSSCASVTQYQTAKPEGKGNLSIRSTLNGNSEFALPIGVEVGVNYGITDDFDFISKLNSFGSMSIGGKYTLLGAEPDAKIAIALGPSMNFFGKISNITIPLHFTLSPNDIFYFTLTPSYTSPGFNKLKDDIDNYYKDINVGFMSFSPYLEAGKKVKFIFGTNFSFANSKTYIDYGLGVKFKIKS